ncbi:MAG: ATP-dependent zinc metalloprotease FtsH [Clostridia bacterium]|nr:ATP-dependent zinc metalloprotease FtsH [Clostridia bacterium]
MKKNLKSLLLYIGIPLVLVLAVALVSMSGTSKQGRKYAEIVDMVYSGEISEYQLNLYSGELKYVLRADGKTYRYTVASPDLFVHDVGEFVRENNLKNPEGSAKYIKYDYKSGSGMGWILNLLPTVLMVGIMIFFIVMFMKRMGDAGGDKALGFGKIKYKKADSGKKTTFADVAGADEEKEEMKEIVDFLKDPSKFNELGARIPKGVLLVGPPGTGKTLLARAVAGEAGVPFFSISGSDFVEMFVGVGASRVRDLFNEAKKNAPAIVFIDEIDAVGRQRGAGLGGGHDEREQTLNQLLVEMDGFGANEGVIIIAATNRPDILDKALLRPGRFDRQITVSYPDVKGREEILKVHARGKPLAPDVSLKTIAKSTAGFTGADLENLLNEAALLAARQGKKAITEEHVEEATIKVIAGPEKKSWVMKSKEKLNTAYHEAGHAILGHILPTQDEIHSITIIPRGRALGMTIALPGEDKFSKYKNEMLEEISMLLGGRIAETLCNSDISTGASNDIERATKIARDMVTKYGMSAELGTILYANSNDEVFLGRDYGHVDNCSNEVASKIDREVKAIIDACYKKGEDILKENIAKLHEVAKQLFENEKLTGDEFREIMEGKPAEPTQVTE